MARKKTTSQMHAELRNLSTEVQTNLFRMIELVAAMLDDKDYVDKLGGEDAFFDLLEAKEFSHFGGNPSLRNMLAAYYANPDEQTWKQYKYNISYMIDLATPKSDKQAEKRTDWKAKCAELQDEVERLRAAIDEYRQRVAELTSKNDQLLSQVGELRGQVKLLLNQQQRVPMSV